MANDDLFFSSCYFSQRRKDAFFLELSISSLFKSLMQRQFRLKRVVSVEKYSFLSLVLEVFILFVAPLRESPFL